MTAAPAKERAVARDANINIRALQRQKELIDEAAEIVGKSRTDFILDAACQKAEDILLDKRVFDLSDEQWDKFLEVLDSPPRNSKKLKKLLNTPAPWDK